MFDPLVQLAGPRERRHLRFEDRLVTEAECSRKADQQNGQRQPDLLILMHDGGSGQGSRRSLPALTSSRAIIDIGMSDRRLRTQNPKSRGELPIS